MTNDLIKQQIESARKAFATTRSRQNPEIMDADDDLPAPPPQSLSRAEQQAEIMDRLSALMMQASKTSRQQNPSPLSEMTKPRADQGRSQETTPPPFWAQAQTDIPPSERFEKAHAMSQIPTEPDTPRAPASRAPQPQTEAQTAELGEALSAIRDEVISHMDEPSPGTDNQELIDRLEALEERVQKHQQDLTALLKLIRQLAARQNEQPERQMAPVKSRGSILLPFLFFIIAIGGVAGWLYWLNPSLLMMLIDRILNQGLILVMQALAFAGLV